MEDLDALVSESIEAPTPPRRPLTRHHAIN